MTRPAGLRRAGFPGGCPQDMRGLGRLQPLGTRGQRSNSEATLSSPEGKVPP